MNDWRNDALCREYDSEIWFPVGETGPALLQLEHAKALCRACPALELCLEAAMDLEGGVGRDGRHGIWGATDGSERATLYRQRNKQRAKERAEATA